MDKTHFKSIIRECIVDVLQESLNKKPEPPKIRKGWGNLNPTTRIHGQGKEGNKPKYNRSRDKNWKKDLDEVDGQENDPMYVEYHKPMRDEVPFMMGGQKFEYCWCKYPTGKIDIGVYAYGEDMCYSYNVFKQRYNIKEDVTNTPSNVYPEDFQNVENYIKIKKKPETGEFVVAWYQHGNFNDSLSYYTDDKQDASSTFEKMKVYVDDLNNKSPVNEMTGTSAVQGFYGKNWVDPDPKRKRMKNIAAKSVGGKVA
jgi:hypothetical protein